MWEWVKMKPVETMERITRQQLDEHLEEILARIDREDIGFVILNENGEDSEVICPAEWLNFCLIETK